MTDGQRITALEAEVAALEAGSADLKDEVAQLKADVAALQENAVNQALWSVENHRERFSRSFAADTGLKVLAYVEGIEAARSTTPV
jgi:hypothetical protein